MFLPSGIKSIVSRSPNFSSSIENVSSTMPSISFSLYHQLASFTGRRRCDLQCPCQISMEIFVNSLHVLECDLLSKHHLIECANKERIQESSMENRQTDNSANELEVVQMFGVDAGVRVDLKGVIIVCRVFKKTIEGVEHFMRKKEKVLAGSLLAYETRKN